MEKDTTQFRESAARCERLAAEAMKERTKALYLEKAERWRWLAGEIEKSKQPTQSGQTEREGGSLP